jgi:cysteine desulfurase / selenocysteine lyase
VDHAAVRSLFPGLSEVVYLDTAACGIGSSPVREALCEWTDRWMAGSLRFRDVDAAAEESRRLFAPIIGADSDEVALIPSVSTAAGTIAAQLPERRSGANVVVGAVEYSSNYFPWLLLKEKGYEVRVVPPLGDTLPVDSFAARIDRRTRLVAVSAVQSATGWRADLPALAEACRQAGAWFFVDAAQAAGALPLDVRREGIDFLATVNNKFLLGTRGIGYLYVRRELLSEMRPVLAGRRAAADPGRALYGPEMELSPTASRLDNTLAWLPTLAEPRSLGILHGFGLANVYKRNRMLADRLYGALAECGLLPDPFPPAHRSTIVSVRVPNSEAAAASLRAGGVIAGARGGQVRLSVHFYNTEAEIDRAVRLLAEG